MEGSWTGGTSGVGARGLARAGVHSIAGGCAGRYNFFMASVVIEDLDTFGPQHCVALSYEEAAQYTRKLAREHYENFSVVSWFLPGRLREDFQNVYAFCRWADDLGDEAEDPQRSLRLLAWWRREIDACYAGRPRHPVFVALHRTIQRHEIPRKPFDDLVDAFVQDQNVWRYETWGQVLDYCQRSANPVGRLVLYLCGYRDALRQGYSDATCTGLQLTNFWQDVRRDILERNRVYIPQEVARQHGLSISQLVDGVRGAYGGGADVGGGGGVFGGSPQTAGRIQELMPAYRATVRELVERTWPLFDEGKKLWPLVSPEVRVDIQLFTAGGESILRMIRRRGYDTLTCRPSLGKAGKAALMLRAAVKKIWVDLRGGRGFGPAVGEPPG